MKQQYIITASIVVVLVLLLLVQDSTSKVTRFYFEKSSLSKNWYYIDTFGFDNQGEKAMGEVSWSFNNTDISLLRNLTVNLYMDENWALLQKSLAKSKYSLPCDVVNAKNFTNYHVDLYKHPNFKIAIKQKGERFWYVILSACERDGKQFKSGSREFIELDFSWQNPGGFFKRQFSKDRQGILAVLMVFTPILTALSIAYLVSVFMLIRNKCFHWVSNYYSSQ
jgi:hypothetical protein